MQKQNSKVETATPKSCSISVVKNEADNIESFVRYNLNVVDSMIIMDNNSSDSTLWILNRLLAEGLPIIIMEDKTISHNQSEKMTLLLNESVKRLSPDIIFPLDADEYITTIDPELNPKEILQLLELDKIYYIKWQTYIPTVYDNKDEPFIPKRINHIRSDSLEDYSKVVITKTIIEKYPLTVAMGNHDITLDKGLLSEKQNKRVDIRALRIAHYPVRSLSQLKSKIYVGWINTLMKPNKGTLEGEHWKNLYNLLKNEKSIDLTGIATSYAVFNRQEINKELSLNPLNISFCNNIEIKYIKESQSDPLLNVLSNCECLAEEYAQLHRDLINLQNGQTTLE
ncbi:MAG: hypothetical protein A2X42_03485 [Candidatus Margulisbacteria bacterium GWF2_38_17]|nr:MAG: hypothetical protein A2X42_03485 [Candidatus Margulisbacteria bacterium GWF2_38_17]